MKRYSLLRFGMIISTAIILSIHATDCQSGVLRNEKFVVIDYDNYLLIYKQWLPEWYAFQFENDIDSIALTDKNDEIVVNEEAVFFSPLKRLLFFKQSKNVTFSLKIHSFEMQFLRGLIEMSSNSVNIEVGSKIIIDLYDRSENIQYNFILHINNSGLDSPGAIDSPSPGATQCR